MLHVLIKWISYWAKPLILSEQVYHHQLWWWLWLALCFTFTSSPASERIWSIKKKKCGIYGSTPPCSTVEVKQDFSIFPLMRTCWTSGSLVHFHTYEDSGTSDFGKSLKCQGGAVIVLNSCLAIHKLYNCLLAKLSAQNTFWESSYRSVGTNSLFSPLNNVDCKIKKKKKKSALWIFFLVLHMFAFCWCCWCSVFCIYGHKQGLFPLCRYITVRLGNGVTDTILGQR